MTECDVTVIIPAFNAGKFLEEALQSVIKQTYSSLEVIIINDGSSDDTEDIVKKFSNVDSRIRYFKYTKSVGVIKARQKGIELANGRFIAFLDSDDVWLCDKVEKQISFMKQTKAAICCTTYEQISEDGNKINKIIHCKEKCNYSDVLKYCPIGNSTVLYDSWLINVKIPNAYKREDYALWLQLTRSGIVIYGLDEVLVKYRVRKGSVSKNKIGLIKWQWNVYRNFEKFSVSKSLYWVIFWICIKLVGIK